ncbi:MAG: hypothetical protein ABI851_06740 [Saprospiraceae bacterium]
MKNKEFDEWIKAKVKDYENLSNQGDMQHIAKPDWQEMSRRMNLEAKDKIFDSQIKNSMQNVRVQSSEANWQNFQKKLQMLRERRNRIITTRIVEMALVLLIFWTIQVVVDQEIIKGNLNKNQPIALAKSSDLEMNDGSKLDQKNSAETFAQISTASSDLKKQNNINSNNNNSNKLAKRNYSKYSTSLNHTLHPNVVKTKVEHPSTQSKESELKQTEPTISSSRTEQTIDLIPFIMDNSSVASPDGSKTIPSDDNENSSNLIQENSVDEESIFENIPPASTSSKIIPAQNLSHRRNIWIGTGLSVNRNTIQSSSLVPDYIDRTSIVANSISKNLRILLDYPKWIIEVGANFSSLEYDPGKYLIFSKFSEGAKIDIIKNIKFQLIELPLILQYKILQTNKSSLMAFSGMSLSMCNKAKYKKIAAIGPKQINRLCYNPNDYSEQIRVEYNNGISVDNSTKGNSFANALIGLKFNYKVLDYFILSSDIHYKSMLGEYGFGPIDQKFKSLNFSLGMYYSLN